MCAQDVVLQHGAGHSAGKHKIGAQIQSFELPTLKNVLLSCAALRYFTLQVFSTLLYLIPPYSTLPHSTPVPFSNLFLATRWRTPSGIYMDGLPSAPYPNLTYSKEIIVMGNRDLPPLFLF